MKYMKSIIFVALSVFMVGTVMSQTTESKNLKKSDHVKKTPEERAQHRTDRMTKKLDLSPAQVAKMNQLNLDIVLQEEVDRKAQKAKKEQQQASIRSVLTPEQALKFDESMAKRKDKRKGKKGKKGEKRKGMKKDQKSDTPEEK